MCSFSSHFTWARVLNFPWFQTLRQALLHHLLSFLSPAHHPPICPPSPSTIYFPRCPLSCLGGLQVCRLMSREVWKLPETQPELNAVSRCESTNVWMSAWDELERYGWGRVDGVGRGERENRVAQRGGVLEIRKDFKKMWKCERGNKETTGLLNSFTAGHWTSAEHRIMFLSPLLKVTNKRESGLSVWRCSWGFYFFSND